MPMTSACPGCACEEACGHAEVHACAKRGRRVPVCHEVCDEHEERADSVEQIRAARIEEIARRAVWILAHHPDSNHVFKGLNMEAELHALGVEV